MQKESERESPRNKIPFSTPFSKLGFLQGSSSLAVKSLSLFRLLSPLSCVKLARFYYSSLIAQARGHEVLDVAQSFPFPHLILFHFNFGAGGRGAAAAALFISVSNAFAAATALPSPLPPSPSNASTHLGRASVLHLSGGRTRGGGCK